MMQRVPGGDLVDRWKQIQKPDRVNPQRVDAVYTDGMSLSGGMCR